MLVLARRPGQKVLFPGLGISVEVLRSKGAVARLGIEAPDEVVIMREEIAVDEDPNETPGPPSLVKLAADRQQRHEWRNKLNEMMLKLQLLQRKIEIGGTTDAETQLEDVLTQLADLEQFTADAIVSSLPPRVLIVEDQDNERELLATCLRLGGINVTTAANGREAFDRLHEIDLPDLILLDMRMPDIDGPTLLKAIRDDHRLNKLRVFAVSGSERSEFDSQPLPLDGWFSKPVRIDALLQAVRNDRTASAVS